MAGALIASVACGPAIEDGLVRVLRLEPTELRLGWQTRADQSCSVRVTASGGALFEVASGPARQHRASVSGLRPETAHSYTVRCGGEPVSGEVRTPAEGWAPFRVAVLGDSGSGSAGQYRLGERLDEARPDLVLHTGDLLYEDDVRKVYLRPYAPLLARVPFVAAVGNHDLERWDAWVELLDPRPNGPPMHPRGRSQWLDFSGARFVVIDSNHGPKSLRYEIGPWLKEVLAAPPAPRWRIVILHHPAYTWGQHDPILPVREELGPVFESAGVDVVLAGHDHNYQRTAPLLDGRAARDGERGVVYVVTGAGGGRLDAVAPAAERPGLLSAGRGDVFSFTLMELGDSSIEARQIADDGSEIDRFRIALGAEASEALAP